jgi:hypothetical protein
MTLKFLYLLFFKQLVASTRLALVVTFCRAYSEGRDLNKRRLFRDVTRDHSG